jgi:hypothetical protein
MAAARRRKASRVLLDFSELQPTHMQCTGHLMARVSACVGSEDRGLESEPRDP